MGKVQQTIRFAAVQSITHDIIIRSEPQRPSMSHTFILNKSTLSGVFSPFLIRAVFCLFVSSRNGTQSTDGFCFGKPIVGAERVRVAAAAVRRDSVRRPGDTARNDNGDDRRRTEETRSTANLRDKTRAARYCCTPLRDYKTIDI